MLGPACKAAGSQLCVRHAASFLQLALNPRTRFARQLHRAIWDSAFRDGCGSSTLRRRTTSWPFEERHGGRPRPDSRAGEDMAHAASLRVLRLRRRRDL